MFGSGVNKKLEDQLFNLKIMIKVLNSNSNKMEKKYKFSVKQIRNCLKKSDDDSALLLADHAVQQRKLQLRYKKLALKLDIISCISQSALETKQSTQGITSILETLSTIQNPVEIVNEIEKFESMFDDIKVTTGVVENTLDASTAMSAVSNEEAKSLISQIKDSLAISNVDKMPIVSVSDGDVEKDLKLSKKN